MKYRYRFGERPLDGYTIRRGVGQGGFGEVYFAVSDGGREVALKSILRNEDIELRGVRECINLKSPQLVSIFDVRQGDDGTAFVIMEYMTGPSLRDLLREHPRGLGEPETVHLIKEIGKGLTCLHDHGIVHRDLKPENIFYEDGRAKIGDYGLAKLLSASRQSGQTMSVGTVHYMAPEIGSGNYQRGVDIYSLGIILHELRTGEVPFDGDSFGEILMKHLTAEPDLSSLTEPFRSIVAGSLVKDPNERFQSVDDMLGPLLKEDSVDGRFSTLHPMTLSSVERRQPAELGPTGVAATLEAPPIPAVESAAQLFETPPAEVAASESFASVESAGIAASAGRRTSGPFAWVAVTIMIVLTGIGEGVLAVARFTGRFLKRIASAPFRRRSRKARSASLDAAPREKRTLVRLFWAFIGSAMFAGGFCLILVSFAQFVSSFGHPDEALILAGVGVGLVVFSRRMLAIVSR